MHSTKSKDRNLTFLDQLRTLELNQNQISKIGIDSFRNCLVHNLDLSGNLISSIDKNIFVDMIQLKNLDLSGN
jgi:Leucine-rich repeat (LRR) protein